MQTHNGNGKSRLHGVHLEHITLPTVVPLGELLHRPGATNAPEAIIPYLAWRERITLLAGREKRGKTSYAATAAAKLSNGGTHLGHQLTPARVLWTLAEGHVDDVTRIMHNAGASRETLGITTSLGTSRLTQLETNIAAWQPDVTFIDTLASFTDDTITSASSSDHWVPILNRITRIAQQHHCAIVLLAHNRKDDQEVRDSTAITATVDMVLRISEHPHKNARRITARGRWTTADHTIILDGTQYRLLDDNQPSSSSHSSHEQRVRQYLADNPHASKYATRKAVGGNNNTTDAIYEQLRAEAGLQAGPKRR